MIDLTEKALKEIIRLKNSNSDNKDSSLRIKVIGGGCSGMSYKLGFDNKKPLETDDVIEKEGLIILIDKKSHLFLAGTELDFSDGLNGRGFVFNNPNAKRTCGCGSSFSA